MSLVNDVLKDLNRRTQQADNAIPIQALQIDVANKPTFFAGFNLGKILLLVGAMLALIVIVQLIINKPISQLFSEPNYVVMKPDSHVIEQEVLAVVAAQELAEPAKVTNPEKDLDQIQIASRKEKKAVVNNTVPPASKAVTADTEADKKLAELEDANAVEVLKVKVPGLSEYQLALKAYKEKRFELALNWVDIALAEQEKMEYQLLKARIFIQNKDATGLYEYVLDHSDLANIEWFKLVAPGLQMFGYHQLSNKYYTALVNKYPEQVKYHLAMALNFSRLGENDKTYQIYQDLSLSQQMTKKQKRWLAAQLSRLDSKKAQHGS
jgi:tetratricopeptide (TPR) repeat protein